MKSKLIRDTCRELFLYGFAEEDVCDLFNLKPKTVYWYMLEFEREVLSNRRKLKQRIKNSNLYYKDLIDQGMYSVHEDEYGTKGLSKYKESELSLTERRS